VKPRARHRRAWPRRALVTGAALAAMVLAARPTAAADGLRRFALIAGNNEGGADTKPLLYAGEDAKKIHAVLTELGGVRKEDTTLLLGRSADDFWTALGALEARAATARRTGQRTVLLVYYSGHAKDGAFRLGKTRVPIDALKQRLAGDGAADVRIGIFDACRSGVVNRLKGARKGPAFEIAADVMHDARGLVLLTSSSADEDSQESDALAGSYFSHHFASGLRGGADRSGDRVITLSEAYEYAYSRTVAETAETAAGAQHPTFDYELKGNGNLVLAELGLGREGLYVPAAAPAGVYYFVDAHRGVVSAEVVKTAGFDRVVALAPGRYRVKRRLPDRLRIGEIEVAAGRFTTLEENRLRDGAFADDPVKGGRSVRDGARFALSLGGSMQAFFDAPTRAGLFPPTGLLAAELVVRDFFRRDWVWGVDLAAGGTRATLVREAVDADLPFRFSELNLGTSLFTEWPLWGGRVAPFLGGRLAFLWLSRTFEGSATAIPAQYLSTFSPGVLTGVRVQIGWGFHAIARGRVHYLHYNVGENQSLGYWELGAVLGYELGASP
jgi:Caspase domain